MKELCPTCHHEATGTGTCNETVVYFGEVDRCGCESICHDDAAKVPGLS